MATDDDAQQIAAAYSSGEPTDQIAARYDCSRSTVYRILQRLGITTTRHRTPYRTDVVELYRQGMTGAQIERATGVPRGSIHSHVQRAGKRRR